VKNKGEISRSSRGGAVGIATRAPGSNPDRGKRPNKEFNNKWSCVSTFRVSSWSAQKQDCLYPVTQDWFLYSVTQDWFRYSVTQDWFLYVTQNWFLSPEFNLEVVRAVVQNHKCSHSFGCILFSHFNFLIIWISRLEHFNRNLLSFLFKIGATIYVSL
jgi:hypothetical protein